MTPVTLLLALGAAHAGLSADGASAESGVENPEAIIVTAQRRAERPEDVPIALSVLSREQLGRSQVTDTSDLDKLVPSLHMTRTGAFTQPFLRGVGKRSTLGVENSVATYVDGVYQASSIGALLDLRGIERVEVLNGPQGTLFGRNTTGGVIQLITRDPGADRSGEAELHAGSYGYIRADAYLNGGTDRLSGNLAIGLSRNDGYGTNLFTGIKSQGEVDHSLAVRSKWIWHAADRLKVTVSGDYQDLDQDFMQLPVKGFRPIGSPRISGFRDGDHDSSNRFHFRYGGVSLRAEAEIGRLDFISLSAARRMHARYGNDLDLGPKLLLAGVPTARQRQFSQEFQLQSRGSAGLSWVAGLYYIHITEKYDPTIFRYGGTYSAERGGRILQTLSDKGDVSSYAAYGQATLSLGKSTRLTGGLRYTVERRTIEAQGERLFDNPPFVRPIPGLPLLSERPIRDKVTFREPTWRLALDRDLSDALMGYLSVTRGFQSGGWNLQTPQNAPFGPERLDDFEGGLKYAHPSGRLNIDVSAFHYRYSDLQVSAFTPIGSVTTNATSARLHGLGLELGALLGERTDVRLGGQWLKTRFNRFRNATCTDYRQDAAIPYLPVSCDVTGNRLPFAPRLKFNAAVAHRIPLGPGSVLLSGNLAYNSGYYSEADNVVRQPSFATLDASVEWRPSHQGPWLRVWALNLNDAEYYDSLVTFPTTGVLQRPAAPRRFGASIGHRF